MQTAVPIIARELRARSRRPLTYWTRLAAAAVGVLLVGSTVSNWTSNGMGRDLAFRVLAWIGFLLAAGSAFSMMDVICGERRNGTLGFLFLTNLSGLDVVLGKFAASAFIGVLVVLGFAPVLMVALLPGGVTGLEVVRVTLALIGTLLVSLALGVCVSVQAPDLLGATRMTLMRLLALMLLALTATLPAPFHVIALLSPLTTFLQAQDLYHQAAPTRFWISTALLFAETTGLILFSSRALARNWREESITPKRAAALAAEEVRRPGKRLGDMAPIPWLVHRQRRQRALFWIAAVLMSFVGSFGLFYGFLLSLIGTSGGAAMIVISFASAFSTLGGAVALALFALAAGRFLMDARQNGTLELLLTTPAGSRDLIGGQKQLLFQMLAKPMIVIVLPAVATLLLALCFAGASSGYTAPIYALSRGLSTVRQVLNVITACTLGMWLGLHCRNAWTLMAWATGLTAGVQWLLSLALRMVMLVFQPPTTSISGGLPLSFYFWQLLLPLVNLLPAVVLILWASHRIRQDLAGIAEISLPWQDLRGWFLRECSRLFASVQRARRWTPAGTD